MLEQSDPLSHNNGVFFDAGMQGMDGFNSTMFVGTNCIWRRMALDSVGGIQYGTISEDFWTGHHAHWLGWDSAYFRKDLQGKVEQRFRLSEGNVPDNVAASLAQRKRWHKGGVELFLGVKNQKDEGWVPPEADVPLRKVSSRVKRFRKFHWFLACISWINVFPAFLHATHAWRIVVKQTMALFERCAIISLLGSFPFDQQPQLESWEQHCLCRKLGWQHA